MDLNDRVRKLIEAALKTKRVATRADLFQKYRLEITVNRQCQGYTNPRVTAAIDATSAGEVTHVTMTPEPAAGVVIITPASLEETGAEALARGASGRTALINMRAALSHFRLRFPKNRNLKMTVTTETLTVDGEEHRVVLVTVKRPRSSPKVSRPRKQGA